MLSKGDVWEMEPERTIDLLSALFGIPNTYTLTERDGALSLQDEFQRALDALKFTDMHPEQDEGSTHWSTPVEEEEEDSTKKRGASIQHKQKDRSGYPQHTRITFLKREEKETAIVGALLIALVLAEAATEDIQLHEYICSSLIKTRWLEGLVHACRETFFRS